MCEPGSRDCGCHFIAAMTVCSDKKGGIAGALGLPGAPLLRSNCSIACKSTHFPECGEEESEDIARLAAYGAGPTVKCFVTDDGYTRLEVEPSYVGIAQLSPAAGLIFFCVFLSFCCFPFFGALLGAREYWRLWRSRRGVQHNQA